MENCSVDRSDCYFTSTIYLDCQNGNIENIKKIVGGDQYDLKKQNFTRRLSILEEAAKHNLDIYRFLLSNLSNLDCTKYGYYGLLYITIKTGYGILADTFKRWFDDVDDNLSNILIDFCTAHLTDTNMIAVFSACLDGQYENFCDLISDDSKYPITDSNGWNLFHVAGMMGNKKMFNFIVSKMDSYAETKDCKGNAPLHLACVKGDMEIIKSLADHHVKSPVNNDLQSPLHFACQYGHVNAVKYFIEDKQWSTEALDKKELTPFLTAIIYGQLDVVDYLCTITSCSVDFHYASKKTILLACRYGHLNIVQYFITDMRCDANITGDKGSTALHVACQYGFRDIVSFLLNTSSINVCSRNDLGMVPLHVASKHGHLNIVKEVASKTPIDILDENRDSPLHHACKNGHLEVAKFLLQSDCNPGLVNYAGFSALQHVARSKFYEVLIVLKPDDMINILQQRSDMIWGILSQAFANDNSDLASFIVRNFETDSSGDTALHYAYATRNVGLVKYLDQEKKLYIQRKNYKGLTPWQVAWQNIEHSENDPKLFKSEDFIVWKYIIKDASYALSCEVLQTNEMFKNLQINTKIIWKILTEVFSTGDLRTTSIILDNFEVDYMGNTALHHACSTGNTKLVNFIYQKNKFYVNHINCLGLTPLQVARNNDHRQIFYNFPDHLDWDSSQLAQPSLLWESCKQGLFSIAKYLIEVKKCNIFIKDAKNWTILHCAASQNKSFKLLKYIVHNTECNLFSLNERGDMPIHVACKSMNWQNLKFLFLMMKDDPQMANDIWFSVFEIVIKLQKLRAIRFLVMYVQSHLEFTDSKGNNILHVACPHNNLGIIEKLFSVWTEDERLSLLLHKNKNGVTPFAIACSIGEVSIIKFLMSNVCLSVSSFQWSILNKAYSNNDLSTITYFSNLYEKDADGSTALHHACSLGNVKVARHIFVHGYRVLYIKNNSGFTSLECACVSGHLNIVKYFAEFLKNSNIDIITSSLVLACKNGHTNIVKYFVEKIMKNFIKEELPHKVTQIDKILVLKNACMSETASVIQYLLNHCFTKIDTNDVTNLLHVACEHGSLEVVKYLLQKFQAADIHNCPTEIYSMNCLVQLEKYCLKKSGYTPLHTAVRYKQLKVASYLLKTQLFWAGDIEGCTPLHIACHYADINCIKAFFSESQLTADTHFSLINSTDNNSKTILHHACCHSSSSDSLEIVTYLLVELSMNASIKDCKGMTALHHSCASGNLEVVNLLVPLCNTSEKDINGKTPLHHAASNGHLDTVKYLVSMEDSNLMCADGNNNTPLHVAVISDKLDIVKFFFDKNYYDPNLRGEDGKTPLIIAASHKCTQTFNYLFYQQADRQMADGNGLKIICYAYDWGREDIIDTLLLYSQVSFSSSCYKTKALLYSAIEAHHFESFKYIFDSLWDCGQNNSSGDMLAQYADSSTNNTALHLASIYGRVDVMKYLILVIKCDPNILNSEGLTCLHLACIHGKVNIVRFISENNVCDPLYTDSSGKTSIHFAAEHNQLEVLQYCLDELKLDPQVKDNLQNTPLHTASQRGYKVIAEYLLNITKSVQYNIDGNTPLHLAVRNEHFGIVEVLLPSARYDIYEKNKQNMSIVDYAQNNTDISRHIREVYGIEANLIPKVFIIGFPGTGKSTLYKAIQKETSLLRYFTNVSEVPPHTVGVKSTEFLSKKYGTVQLYDFAGDEEYHANHQLLFQNTPLPIVILLINLTWSEEDIISNLKYWIRILINSRSTHLELKKSVKVVIVGSHYDKTHDNKDFLSKVNLSIKDVMLQSQIEGISFAKQLLFMNCKRVVSAGMTDLQDQLHSICISCRAEIVKLIPFKMSLMCQKVLDMIYEEMSNEIAFSLETLCMKAREMQFIPKVVASENEIIEYCNGLCYYGKILLLKDYEQPSNSWVILNENYILSKFHESMKMLCCQSTNTKLISCGLISLQQLQSEFKEQLEVIVKYLKHFQICTEVSTKSFSIIPSSLKENECQYYFFPSLIMQNRPDIFQNNPNDKISLCYGWQLTYNEPPPPRFLQVLFVQLTVPVPGAGDVLQPVFNVWRNGIHIRYNDTTECVIEVSDTLTQLTFSIRCHKGNETKLLLRRSCLVDLILSMLAKNCPSITFSEYIFEPQHSFPVSKSLKKASLNRIAGAIIEGRTTVISSDASEYLDLKHLLCSEPILNLKLLQLKRIHLHLEDRIPNSVLRDIYNAFTKNWNDHDEIKNYKHLKTVIFSYSIFTDRNIWDVANVELKPLPIYMIEYKFELDEVSCYITGHHPLTISLKEGETVKIPFQHSSKEEYCYGHYLSRSLENLEPTIVEDCVMFHNVRKEDGGRYELHPKHKGWSGEIQFILNVEYEPIYVFAKGSQPYFEVYEGSTKVILFTVSSFPVMPDDVMHTITFFKGPHEVPATTRFEVNDSAITLNNIQLEDSGMYQISCKSINGQVGKTKFELHVWTQPNYRLTNSVVEVLAGTTQTIPFTISSISPLSSAPNHILKYVTKDGTEDSLGDNFKATQDAIILNNLKTEDAGTYQISFCNEDGASAKEQFQLNVFAKDEVDDNSEQTQRQTIIQKCFHDIPEANLTVLDEEISDRSLRRVAYKLIHWEEKCDLFDLERNPDVEDIHECYKNKPFMQRIEVLTRWQQRTCTPTYENLLQICLKGEFTDSATVLVEIVKESVTEDLM